MHESDNQETIHQILNYREWQSFECKRALVKPAKILETIVAFANTEGGIFILGLEDPDKAQGNERLFGISENSDNISEVQTLLKREIDPHLQFLNQWEISILNREKKEDRLWVIHVAKSNDVHSLKNGDTFIRSGSHNVKIGSSQIIRLKYEKGVIKYESEASGLDSLDELDSGLLEKFKKESRSQSTDQWQFLKDNGLALKRNDKWELTKGGALLFAKNPAVVLGSKCSIKVTHYLGTNPSFTENPNFLRRPFSIEGPLLEQITRTIDYFRDAVRSSPPKLTGATFKPTLLIPEWVFQEAVTNSVIHRDYSLQDDTHIRFFDDRIEVESPGTYPGHITISNIRHERFARNPLILRALNRFVEAPNLDHGEGIDRMFSIMRTHNLYEPLYLPPQTRPHSVLVILLNIQRVEYWDTVSQYLDKHSSISNREARKVTGITDTIKMSRLLKLWVKKGLLEKQETGSKKETLYHKPGIHQTSSLFAGGGDNKSFNFK